MKNQKILITADFRRKFERQYIEGMKEAYKKFITPKPLVLPSPDSALLFHLDKAIGCAVEFHQERQLLSKKKARKLWSKSEARDQAVKHLERARGLNCNPSVLCAVACYVDIDITEIASAK